MILKDREVQALLQVSRSTLWRLRNEPDGVPFMRVGGGIRYDRDAVLEWAARRGELSRKPETAEA